MKRNFKILLIILLGGLGILPSFSSAATTAKFYYAGWMPYWKQQSGSLDAALNLDKFQEMSPFSYEVKSNGTLVDKLKLDQGFWPTWLSAARDAKIKITPTIAWFDGQAIQNLLSNSKKRLAQEDAITKLVKTSKFDGIDIDYESKLADTKPYFSLFIKGLAMRLHPLGKILSCTVEARMPADVLLLKGYSAEEISQKANDYTVLNQYCDEVRIMAYDQGVIDPQLNASKGIGQLYAPVADIDWTKKILTEAMKTINRKKIMLGIPTYGYEYEITWENGQTTYNRLRTHTFLQAMNRADSVGATPMRNSAGELSFTYATGTFVDGVSDSLTWTVSSTKPAAITSLGTNPPVTRFVSFADAQSAANEIALAKKLGLRGAVFFKWDGETDPTLWDKMK